MITPTLTRQQLEIINRRSLKYPLQVAEKDYFLAIVLQILSTSSWGEKLVFKGGTALHHCYLEQYRFSEDLDFSSNGVRITLEDVRSIFNSYPFLGIRKEFSSEATLKVERLQYSGPLALPNSLKVEIDVNQNVYLPPVSMVYKNVWGLEFPVRVMDIREICAEKIRAMSDRARFRDFYDLFLVVEKFKPEMDEVVSLIRKKEIRQSITKTNILNNWAVVGAQKAKEMRQIHYSREVEDELIQSMVADLPFVEIS